MEGGTASVDHMASLHIAALVITATLCFAGLGLGLLAQNQPLYEGGRLATISPDGRVSESSVTVAAYAALTAAPTRTRATLLTTGAAVLNVTVDLVRHGPLRSWNIWTEPGGSGIVTEVNTSIVIPLSGTDLLLPSDMPAPPLSTPDATQTYHMVPCSYRLTPPDRYHLCTLFYFPGNATLEVRAEKYDAATATATTLEEGFDAYHFNATITIEAMNTWVALTPHELP